MIRESTEILLSKIEELENRLAESEQLIEAIKAGEVDAFAIKANDKSEVYTLQSGDYAYRVLIEEFGEGALNLTEDGLIVYSNPYFFELLNLQYEQVVGTSIFDFIHNDSHKKFNELLINSLKGRSKGEINLAVKDKKIPVYISLTSLQPALPTVGLIISDLTEKKNNEQIIADYQLNLQKAYEALLNKNRDLEQQILNEFSESFSEYKTGADFFNSLVQDVADKTKIDFVFLGELIEINSHEFEIKTFAITAFGKPAKNIRYPLPGGPCEQVIKGKLYSYPEQCMFTFPKNPTLMEFKVEGYIGYPLFDIAGKPIGLIAVMHQKKITEVDYIQSLLKIAAKRTEIELERIKNEEKLASKNKELLRTNKELIDTKNFLNAILESSNNGILSYHTIRENNKIIDFEIRYANDIAIEQINLPKEEVIGKRYLTILPLFEKLGLFHRAVRVVETGISETHETNSPNFPDRCFMVHYSPLDEGVTATMVDITEQKKQAKQLQEKNLELQRSNTELASFSYIASHDLQEPLRKIQTFSNRILDKDFENLSVKTRDYFQRIIAASTRMQSLIEALLNYSRTNTSEIIFKTTDLNELLEEVKHNLREVIEENHVSIESSTLPALDIIPLQFNQLFTNIIGNAIKYRRTDVNLLIRFDAQEVPAAEIPFKEAFMNAHYCQINITDNGIGFEPQYAERIFELFQRLHVKTEYEGTGIGLAICKKIIQNHGGFIKATGQPGIGSTFSLYLPLNN
ncbi:MAG: ATP-binding protein [Chitinophagales bacterium]